MRIAAIQMQSLAYAAEVNRATTLAHLEAAAATGARLAILPELAVSGYGIDREGLKANAEPADGPTLAAWTAVARKHGMIIVGGFCEREGDALYNAAMMVDANGLVGHYRKLHLFDGEKTVFTPGDKGLPVYETALGVIGLCVCYDLRFVEVVRALALQGADMIAVPTAWVGGFDKVPRDAMGYIGQVRGAAVQANLSQVFIACASQAGARPDMRFLGSSVIVDPYGDALAGPLDDESETVLSAEIDLETAVRARIRSDRVRPREDRRTDVYGLMVNNAPL